MVKFELQVLPAIPESDNDSQIVVKTKNGNLVLATLTWHNNEREKGRQVVRELNKIIKKYKL